MIDKIKAILKSAIYKSNKKSKKMGDLYYGKVAQGYSAKRSGSKKWQIEQTTVEEYLKEISDGSKVLDIPFGTGRFVEMYLKKGMTVYGLDISADMLNAAREELGDSFERCITTAGDATSTLPYDDNYFDVIVCWRFLKFFSYETAKNILQEFHRVSKSKVILRVAVRKEGALPVSHPKRLKKIGGNIFEKDLFELFHECNLKVCLRKMIYDVSEEFAQENTGPNTQMDPKAFKEIYAYMLDKQQSVNS